MSISQQQDERFLGITLSNFSGDLLLIEFTGKDYISAPFRYFLTVLCDPGQASKSDFIGQSVTVRLGGKSKNPNYFNAIVESVVEGGAGLDGRQTYHLVVSPWLSFLTMNMNSRLFGLEQSMTIPQIVVSVIKEAGFSDVDTSSLTKEYSPVNFCLQYQENDFNFISRLLLKENIYYYFKHEDGKHTLYLSDQGLPEIDNKLDIDFNTEKKDAHVIYEMSDKNKVVPVAYSQWIYDFKNPDQMLKSKVEDQAAQKKLGSHSLEIFNTDCYAEGFDQKKLDDLCAMRLLAQKSKSSQVFAKSRVLLTAGGLFSLTDNTDAQFDGDYVVTSIEHFAQDMSFRPLHSDSGAVPIYKNVFYAQSSIYTVTPLAGYKDEFHFFDADTFHNKDEWLKTQVVTPHITGTQSAFVVAPEGQDIYTDKFARIKVQFYWDRYGKKDERSSSWIRMNQAWTGDGYGMQFIPRVGQEVLVSFLNGSPDYPIIAGPVPNSVNPMPFSPEKTPLQSGFLTRTIGETSPDFANKLQFDDDPSKPAVALQAQKNFYTNSGKNYQKRVLGEEGASLISGDYQSSVKQAFSSQSKQEVVFSCGKSSLEISPSNVNVEADEISLN